MIARQTIALVYRETRATEGVYSNARQFAREEDVDLTNLSRDLERKSIGYV